MKAQPFVVTPKDYDPALNVLGVKITGGGLRGQAGFSIQIRWLSGNRLPLPTRSTK